MAITDSANAANGVIGKYPLIPFSTHFAQGQHTFDVCQHHPKQDNKFAENRVLLDLVAWLLFFLNKALSVLAVTGERDDIWF